MSTNVQVEHWLRGNIPGISSFLQPVAHALLQAKDEVSALMQEFPGELLWQKPAGLASPGFHLQHLTGVLDRLFTYADGNSLTEAQLLYLKKEGDPAESGTTVGELVRNFCIRIDQCLLQLKERDENTLTEHRGVGRAQLPSTVLGLLFHAAEHTMRHTGQLLVTVAVLKDLKNGVSRKNAPSL
jgi:hypothetical protein